MTYFKRKKSIVLAMVMALSGLLGIFSAITPAQAVEPLQIINMEVPTINDVTATIEWETNRRSDARVEYGQDANNLNFTLSAAGPIDARHAITIHGLLPETRYYVRAISRDASHVVLSEIISFETVDILDNRSPRISKVQVHTTGTTATVQWETDEPADSKVIYGHEETYGQTRRDSRKVVIHDITIKGLAPGNTYHFNILSKDPDNNESRFFDQTFRTLISRSIDLSELVLFAIKPVSENDVNVSDTTANISWRTNKLAKGRVIYGLAGGRRNRVAQTGAPRDHFQSLTLGGLQPGTRYEYEVEATDIFNKRVRSEVYSFTTKGGNDLDIDVFQIDNGQRILGAEFGSQQVFFDEGSGFQTGFFESGALGSFVPSPPDGPTWTASPWGQALAFDGVNDYLRLPGQNVSGLNAGSISLWLNRHSIDNSSHPDHPDWEVIDGFFSKQHNWVNSWLVFGFDKNTQNKLRFQVSNGNSIRGNADLPLNDWVQVVATWNGNEMRLYVNGQPDASAASTAVLGADSADLSIGAWHEHGGEYLDGAIDNFRFYTYDLSATEIANLYAFDQANRYTGSRPAGFALFTGGQGGVGGPGSGSGTGNGAGNGSGAGQILGTSTFDYTQSSKLIRLAGTPDIYTILNGQKHYVSGPTSMAVYGYSFNDVVEVNRNEFDGYPTVRLVKTPDNSSVYFLYERGDKQWLKLAIPSPTVFVSYEDNFWGNVVTINQLDLNSYPDAHLLRTDEDPGVYQLEGQTKRLITSEDAFVRNGFKTPEIVEVSPEHMAYYELGDPIQ